MELFKGKKLTAIQPLESLEVLEIKPDKEVLYNLLLGHGNVCKPLVKPGDIILVNQPIAEAGGAEKKYIYSSISGKVVKLIDS